MKTINFAKIFADNRAQIMLLNKPQKIEIVSLQEQAKQIESSDLNEIKGIGQATVKKLLEN